MTPAQLDAILSDIWHPDLRPRRIGDRIHFVGTFRNAEPPGGAIAADIDLATGSTTGWSERTVLELLAAMYARTAVHESLEQLRYRGAPLVEPHPELLQFRGRAHITGRSVAAALRDMADKIEANADHFNNFSLKVA